MYLDRTEPLVFIYRFRFPRKRVNITVRLNPQTLHVVGDGAKEPASWCRLEHHQCPNCPLQRKEHPFCPVAANLEDVVVRFKNMISFKRVELTVSRGLRHASKMTTAADGLASLMGIHMAGSGCPILDRLRPMLLTHTPFASGIETFYRSFSTHLMRQFFVRRGGGRPDWTQRGMERAAQEVQRVNRAFAKRLVNAGMKDAVLNGLAQLDAFANLIDEPLLSAELDRVQKFFRPGA
ncbi:MAG: hypothetical protein NTX64_12550 [Elusimicrobia bacterium]|nr:hypothetical protein [Elusimicrobiota bacterium]